MRVGHGGATLGFYGEEGWYRELGFGLVVLTNTRGATGFANLVEMKLSMLGLPANLAEEALQSAITLRQTELAEAAQRIRVSADAETMRPWLGHFETDTGLDFTVREDAGAFVVDEGTWHSRVGLLRNPTDPLEQFVLLDAPFAGVSFSRREEAGSRVLILEAGQSVYRFVQGSSPSPAH